MRLSSLVVGMDRVQRIRPSPGCFPIGVRLTRHLSAQNPPLLVPLFPRQSSAFYVENLELFGYWSLHAFAPRTLPDVESDVFRKLRFLCQVVTCNRFPPMLP